MDKILTLDVAELPNQRITVFQLLKRFEKDVLDYQRKYLALCQSRDRDLADKKKKAAALLQNLDNTHNARLQTLDQELNRSTAAIQSQMNECRRQMQQKNQSADSSYRNWHSQEWSNLDVMKRQNEDKYRADMRIYNQIVAVRRDTEKCIGVKRFEKFARNAKNATLLNATSSNTASYFNGDGVRNAENWKKELLRIRASFWMKLFFRGKQTRLCENLYKLEKETQFAMQARQSARLTQQKAREDTLAIANSREQQALDQKLKANQAEFNARQKTLERQQASARTRCQQQKDAETVSYNRNRAAQQKALTDQLADAGKDWNDKLQQTEKAFCAAMEQTYPAKEMDRFFRGLWAFETDWSRMQPAKRNAVRNVPVGVAYLDISKWYQSESGPCIDTLMRTRYPILLRRNTRTTIHFPCTLSLDEGNCIIIQAPDKVRGEVKSIVSAIGMRLLLAIPVEQISLLLSDTEDMVSFAGLAGMDPASGNTVGHELKSILDGGQLCGVPSELQQRIGDIASYIAGVGGQMGSRSLWQFNRENPRNCRKYRLALLAGFPYGMNADSLRQLRLLANGCGKYGYNAILAGSVSNSANLDDKLRPELEELQRQSVVLQCDGQSGQRLLFKTVHSPVGETVYVRFARPAKTDQVDKIRAMLRQAAEEASKNLVFFEQMEDLCPPRNRWFTQSATENLIVPLGFLDGGNTFLAIFDDNRVHTLINGETGSGKTNLLHVLITNTLLRYGPSEAQIYLIDFKYGTEFRKYTQYNLPNFKAVSICNEPEFALMLLREVKQVIEARQRAFGSNINNLKSYNQRTGKHFPRILLIVDELYQLVEDAQHMPGKAKVKDEIMALLVHFAVQGRAYGIHMVISGQNLTQIPEINKSIAASCSTKIVLRCASQQATALIGREGAERMRQINALDKGACVIATGSTPPEIEHTAYLDPTVHEKLLRQIHDHYCQAKQRTQVRVLNTDVATSRSNVYQRYLRRGDMKGGAENCLYLGEYISIQIRNPGLSLDHDNLWIAGGMTGQAENAGKSACLFALLSLALEQRCLKSVERILFCSGSTGGSEDRAAELCRMMPNQLKAYPGNQVETMIGEAARILQTRMQTPHAKRSDVWLVFQRLEECIFTSQQSLDWLQQIIQAGPAVGVRTLVWTPNVARAMQDLRLQNVSFRKRLALEMPSTAYQSFLSLKPDREPYGYQAVTQNDERIRVYDLPDRDWVRTIAEKLRTAPKS